MSKFIELNNLFSATILTLPTFVVDFFRPHIDLIRPHIDLFTMGNILEPIKVCKLEMTGSNATVTLPGVKNAIEAQMKESDYLLNLYQYISARGVDELPSAQIWKDLVKHAVELIEDSLKLLIDLSKTSNLAHICGEYSIELTDIKNLLSSAEDQDIEDCADRCAVLVDKIEKYQEHALDLAALFNYLFFVYIVVGLAQVEHQRTRESADKLNWRLSKVKRLARLIKFEVIRQRIDLVKMTKSEVSGQLVFRDEMRDDMERVGIASEELVAPVMDKEVAERVDKVDHYKVTLAQIYSNYFGGYLVIIDTVSKHIADISKNNQRCTIV